LAPRSSTCDAQGTAPRAAVWAPRPSTCDTQGTAPWQTAWPPRPSTCVEPQASASAPRINTVPSIYASSK
jgi:hypothetical protein